MCTMHTTHMLGALQKKYTNSTLKNRVCTHSRSEPSWCTHIMSGRVGVGQLRPK